MAHDEVLASRVRALLSEQESVVEKKMFGGTAFMVQGNMACGVHKEYLIVRVGPERYTETIAHPHTRPFDMTGKPMKGWVMVTPEGCAAQESLAEWVLQGMEFAMCLPAK